jgi:hypothetical protein
LWRAGNLDSDGGTPVDLEPIPLADFDSSDPAREDRSDDSVAGPSDHPAHARSRSRVWFEIVLIVVFCSLHALGIWWALGGRAGLTNGWPLWRNDHPLYFHSSLVTRSFLKDTWTTAGYDPAFMAGYPKSVVFPASSTLPELVIAAFGGDHPALTYKLYVLISAAAVPWLIALACAYWGLSLRGAIVAVLLDLVYIWTDFPMRLLELGMVPYFLAIPLALVAVGAFARFLCQGGVIRWLAATVLLSLAFLVHLTTAMVFVPAAALAYAASVIRFRRRTPSEPRRRRASVSARPELPATRSLSRRKFTALSHATVWLIPVVVLAANAFWWLPGVFLAATKGFSGFVYIHPEGALRRFIQIVGSEAPIESILLGLGIPGFLLVFRKNAVAGWALFGFCGAGMLWGYLAAESRALDFLQTGRHTYAFYNSLAVAGAAGVDEFLKRLRAGSAGVDHLDRWVMAGIVLIGIRMVGYPGYPVLVLIQARLGTHGPSLPSEPPPRLVWIIDQLKSHLRAGERLLYEEGGFGADPFDDGRFSGLLPERTGLEVIGGPYLHASVTTNFTQFGEGRLCGKSPWSREDFLRCVKLYRPSAILCWSAYSRRFCEGNPDLIEVFADDQAVLIGRIRSSEGDFLEGSGRLEAAAGRIRVHEMTPGLDGSIVLRYHIVPYLATNPPVVKCEPEFREDDPVPFIRLRPPPGTSDVELTLQLPVGR